MSNFKINFIEPWTTYDNKLIQEETVFENPYQKLCYLFLYSYARAEKIFPSMEKIAAACCCKKRHAIKVIQRLEEMGFIEVERTAGKANNYALNDYFAVAATMHGQKKTPVHDEHRCTTDTGAQQTPVHDEHHTGAQQTPVLPKLVHNEHPKTRLEKTKSKTSISLARLEGNNYHVSGMENIDNNLITQYPDVPFIDIKAKMLEDADEGKIVLKTGKQYSAMLKHRIEDWIRSKRAESAQIRKKKPIRTEVLPEWFESENEAASGLKIDTDDELEAKKKAIEDKLKKFRGE